MAEVVAEQYRAIDNAVRRPLARWWRRSGCYFLALALCAITLRAYWFWFFQHGYLERIYRGQGQAFPLGMDEWQWDQFFLLTSTLAEALAIALWLFPAGVVVRAASQLSAHLPHPWWPAFRQGLYLKLLSLAALPFALGLLSQLAPLVMLGDERNPLYVIEVLGRLLTGFIDLLLAVYQPLVWILAFAVLSLQRPLLFWAWGLVQCLGRPLLLLAALLAGIGGIGLEVAQYMVDGVLPQVYELQLRTESYWFSADSYVGYSWELGGLLVLGMLLLLVWGRRRLALRTWMFCIAAAVLQAVEPLLYHFAGPAGSQPFARLLLVLMGPAHFSTSWISSWGVWDQRLGVEGFIVQQPLLLVKPYAEGWWLYLSWLINLGWLALCIFAALAILRLPSRAER